MELRVRTLNDMDRVFSIEDQLQFAELSGDYNPIHVDPIAARRLLFGRPVVHGIHVLLWAVDQFIGAKLAGDQLPIRIEKLKADWGNPALVGDRVTCSIASFKPDQVKLEVRNGAALLATFQIAFQPQGRLNDAPAVKETIPEKTICRERSADDSKADLIAISGALPLHLAPAEAKRLFPQAHRLLLPQQMAAILATTRLVGMEAPGLHSLYTGLELLVLDAPAQAELQYHVNGFDERFKMFLPLKVTAPGFTGTVSATFRPKPTSQSDMAEFLKLVRADEFAGINALVIGGSRGLGEIAVKALAAGGADVRFTYHRGEIEATKLVEQIKSTGRNASTFKYSVIEDSGKLDALLGNWYPELLCFFATPSIAATLSSQFESQRFKDFCDVYVDGFVNTFYAVKKHDQRSNVELKQVLYPSSSAIDELPPKLGEYASAKAAAETACNYLSRIERQTTFSTPRYGKLATDQTASVIGTSGDEPNPVILKSLRDLRDGKVDGKTAPAQSSRSTISTNIRPQGPNLAVAATFTAEPAEPTLQFWLEKINWNDQVTFAPFNQVFQSLLDPQSAINTASGAGALLIRLQDWVETDHQAIPADQWKSRLEPIVDEFLTAVGAGRKCPLIIALCPASEEIQNDPASARVFADFENRILQALKSTSDVHAFSTSEILSLYPTGEIHDPRGDEIGRVPYKTGFFTSLATFVVRKSHAARMKPYKVIVLDCDNTLWKGVCGEGGVSAVSIDANFRAVQEMAVAQIDKGRVICLNSKNVEQDVFDVFDNHKDMVLRRDQIVGFRINWQPKSQNLRELAKELNLGVDSFIFLDDNPIECAEVRENCPEALTIQLPKEPADIPAFLKNLWPLDQLRVTDQDRARTQSYLHNAHREEIRKKSSGLDDFLAKLNLEMNFLPVDPSSLPRASQLTERTNQFNVSTIRRGESQVKELLNDPKHSVEIVSVKDRFGDYGIVGEVITRRESDKLVVDTFLLSCRVLGRGVEHRMIARTGLRARELGINVVEIPFIRTKKNQPALDFLNSIAADVRSETSDGYIYRIPVEKAVLVKATETRAASELPQEGGSKSAPVESAAPLAPYQEIAEQWSDVEVIGREVLERQKRQNASNQSTQGAFTLPRTESETKMAEIWKRVLNTDKVSVHDDYFSLGGTSLMAVRLVLDVEKVFGKQIPIAMLLKAPTIAKLCEHLDGKSDAGDASRAQLLNEMAVVPLREDGVEMPLIVFPGVGGHTLSYLKFAQLLKSDRPIYGMDLRPDWPANREMRSLETMAKEFVGRLLKFKPQGPYYLGGYSFGGYLAFAVAHELRSMGKEVPFLLLFDTYGPGFPRTLNRSERLAEHLRRFKARSPLQNIKYCLSGVKVTYGTLKHRFLRAIGARKTDFYMYPSKEIEQIVHVFTAAVGNYKPPVWNGTLQVIRSRRRPDRIGISYADPTNGWGPLATKLVVREVDADHLSLFDDPDVVEVAAVASEMLRSADEQS